MDYEPLAPKEKMMSKSMTESAVRARANTRGYRIRRSRERSRHGDNHGEFMLMNPYRNCIVMGQRFDASLEDISEYLDDANQEECADGPDPSQRPGLKPRR
jgi:hypothetical protein